MQEDEETDSAALRAGFISVTPLHFDMTAYESIAAIGKWKLKR